MNKKERNEEIRTFIINNIEENGHQIIALITDEFGITKQTASYHLEKLKNKGIITSTGQTRNKKFELAKQIYGFSVDLNTEANEDKIWREKISDKVNDFPKNIKDICAYGFTERLNNAIDHSGSDIAIVKVVKTIKSVGFQIYDDGIGIFEKIKQGLNLNDHLEALLELSKGKLTTDPERHSGEGIFFTSRMFDSFIPISISNLKMKLINLNRYA